MDGVSTYLVTACLVVLAVVVAMVWRRQRDRPRRPVGSPRNRSGDGPQGDPRRIEIGDVVEIGEASYPVIGTIRLVDGGWSWAEHLLDDPTGLRRRLSVEDGPALELVLWEAAPGATVAPGAPTIEFAGRRYSWNESGQARYTATGRTGLGPSGTMRFHDYQAPGGGRLSFEAYGAAGWEVARGERLHRSEVVVRPQAEMD